MKNDLVPAGKTGGIGHNIMARAKRHKTAGYSAGRGDQSRGVLRAYR